MNFVQTGWESTVKMAEKLPKADEVVVVIAGFVPKAISITVFGPKPEPAIVTTVPTWPEIGETMVICGLGLRRNMVVA